MAVSFDKRQNETNNVKSRWSDEQQISVCEMFFPDSTARLLPELVLNENRCLFDRNWIIERNLSGVTSCCDVMLLHENRSTSFEDEFLNGTCRRAYGYVMCHKYSSPDVNGQWMVERNVNSLTDSASSSIFGRHRNHLPGRRTARSLFASPGRWFLPTLSNFQSLDAGVCFVNWILGCLCLHF